VEIADIAGQVDELSQQAKNARPETFGGPRAPAAQAVRRQAPRRSRARRGAGRARARRSRQRRRGWAISRQALDQSMGAIGILIEVRGTPIVRQGGCARPGAPARGQGRAGRPHRGDRQADEISFAPQRTIEAGRAPARPGAGFAVVAGEVKSLAQSGRARRPTRSMPPSGELTAQVRAY